VYYAWLNICELTPAQTEAILSANLIESLLTFLSLKNESNKHTAQCSHAVIAAKTINQLLVISENSAANVLITQPIIECLLGRVMDCLEFELKREKPETEVAYPLARSVPLGSIFFFFFFFFFINN
jgi:hypothetical protein